jgi:hypothetical protein
VARSLGHAADGYGFVAEDTQALLPDGTSAGILNYNGDGAGITAVAVDFSALPAAAGPSASAFSFLVGDGTTWLEAPAPASVGVLRGGGTKGSDRVLITWSAGAIMNTWLQVVVKSGLPTALSRDDVFCFGNLAGDTGDTPADGPARAVVNVRDIATMRRLAAPETAHADSRFDFNHDGAVDGADLLVTRLNNGAFLPLFASAAPTGAPASGATPTGGAKPPVAGGGRARPSRARRTGYDLLR